MIDDPAIQYATEFYNYPITRFGAYYVGVFFGMMYFEWMKERKNPSYYSKFGAKFYNAIKNNRILRHVLFLSSSVMMVLLIIAPRLELHQIGVRKIGQIPSDIFNTFHRTVFVTSLGLFLAGPMVGKMDFVRGAFGGKLWAPGAKVTFTAYLFHMAVLCWVFLQIKGAGYITGAGAVFYSFAVFLITVIFSVPITLIIESPILQLERLIIFPQKQKPLRGTNEIERKLINNNVNMTDSEVETSTKSIQNPKF